MLSKSCSVFCTMDSKDFIRPIVLYFIERHPLDSTDPEQTFRWLTQMEPQSEELEALIGPHEEEEIVVLIDQEPGGPNWALLLQSLLEAKVTMVVTHLAPLSSAQRQQLIGICDQMGAQLITPGDAGRSRLDFDAIEP
jgi:hypothetical protein